MFRDEAVAEAPELENDYDEPDYVPGAVDIDLGLTINLQNFQSFKVNIGINEPYSGRPGDTRNDKVNEVIDFIQKTLDEKVAGLTIHNKKLANVLAEGISDLGSSY